MSNERFLIVSYFSVAAFSLGLGTAVYFWFRRSFGAITGRLAGTHLPRTLRRAFPVGLILPAMLGFLSVSYYSCSVDTYEQVIANRVYLEQKSREQAHAVLWAVMFAVLAWGFLVPLVLSIARRRKEDSDSAAPIMSAPADQPGKERNTT